MEKLGSEIPAQLFLSVQSDQIVHRDRQYLWPENNKKILAQGNINIHPEHTHFSYISRLNGTRNNRNQTMGWQKYELFTSSLYVQPFKI